MLTVQMEMAEYGPHVEINLGFARAVVSQIEDSLVIEINSLKGRCILRADVTMAEIVAGKLLDNDNTIA